MGFGTNPHVAKAEAAELKASEATDEASSDRAWLEAGRLWERAAERERDGRRRSEYAARAAAARDNVSQ